MIFYKKLLFILSLPVMLFAGTAHEETAKKIALLKKDLGISFHELHDIVLFIEGHDKKAPYYLRKEITKLARTIEYAPDCDAFFIHLKRHGIAEIGRGSSKKVTYSILYDRENPELIANCSVVDTPKNQKQHTLIHNEKKAIEALQNIPGIVSTYAITTHLKKNGKKSLSFLQKFCQGTSLKEYFEKQKKPALAIQEIYHTLKQTLDAIHAKGFVHGDVNLANCICSGDALVLLDFGHTTPIEEAYKSYPKIQASRVHNPPEIFFSKNEGRDIDPVAVELYALGVMLYRLYFNKYPEWIGSRKRFLGIETMNQRQREVFGKKLLKKLKKKSQKCARQFGSDPFVSTILTLCDPDPEKRKIYAHSVWKNSPRFLSIRS